LSEGASNIPDDVVILDNHDDGRVYGSKMRNFDRPLHLPLTASPPSLEGPAIRFIWPKEGTLHTSSNLTIRFELRNFRFATCIMLFRNNYYIIYFILLNHFRVPEDGFILVTLNGEKSKTLTVNHPTLDLHVSGLEPGTLAVRAQLMLWTHQGSDSRKWHNNQDNSYQDNSYHYREVGAPAVLIVDNVLDGRALDRARMFLNRGCEQGEHITQEGIFKSFLVDILYRWLNLVPEFFVLLLQAMRDFFFPGADPWELGIALNGMCESETWNASIIKSFHDDNFAQCMARDLFETSKESKKIRIIFVGTLKFDGQKTIWLEQVGFKFTPKIIHSILDFMFLWV
jgi:hypothetical protein